jgi:hypothetical protein
MGQALILAYEHVSLMLLTVSVVTVPMLLLMRRPGRPVAGPAMH